MPKSMPLEKSSSKSVAQIYLIVDTNVVVSSLLKEQTPPWRIINKDARFSIVFCANDDIMAEYKAVLHRAKFGFTKGMIDSFFANFNRGLYPVSRKRLCFDLPDPKDACFYEAYLIMRQKSDFSFLVTGNLRHFPKDDHILSPRELLDLLESWDADWPS